MSDISARSVSKFFGSGETRTFALRGADFDARAGEMTFLVGPSGCGKSTLISILASLLKADSGDVRVFGTDPMTLRGIALARFRRDTVGFIFQQFNLLPALDAAENAAVPLIAQGVAGSIARRRAADLLDRLGLGSSLAKFPAQLSGGQQQRVAIARALVHEPRLLICDEPTASLDAASGQIVMEMLRDLGVQKDRAAIVVTHDERIYRFADRIAYMADGRVVKTRVQQEELT